MPGPWAPAPYEALPLRPYDPPSPFGLGSDRLLRSDQSSFAPSKNWQADAALSTTILRVVPFARETRIS